MRLVEALAAAVSQNEAVLLVGETGTGKTSMVQHLADKVCVVGGAALGTVKRSSMHLSWISAFERPVD